MVKIRQGAPKAQGKSRMLGGLIALSGLLLSVAQANAAPFTAGNLVVLRADASANNTTGALVEVDDAAASTTAV